MKRILILILTVVAVSAQYTDFYCRTNGNNLNAGSTESTTVTFSAAGGNWTNTTGVWYKSGVNLSAVSVGMFASVHTDATTTETPFVGLITAVDDTADSITVSLTQKGGTAPATTTANDMSIKVGGAWAGPTDVGSFPFNSSVMANTLTNNAVPFRLLMKDDAFFNWTNPVPTATQPGPFVIEGYTATAGDGGVATFYGGNVTGGGPFTMLNLNAAAEGWHFRNIRFLQNRGDDPGAGLGGANMVINQAHGTYFYNCTFEKAYRGGLQCTGNASRSLTLLERCQVLANNYDDAAVFGGLDVDDNTVVIDSVIAKQGTIRAGTQDGRDSAGIQIGSLAEGESLIIINSVIAGNTGNGIEFTGGGHVEILNCTIDRNGTINAGEHNIDLDSFPVNGFSTVFIRNSIISNAVLGYGIQNDAVAAGYPYLRHVAHYGNTGGFTNNVNGSFVTGTVALSADPYVDGANGNWSLNNTAGGGALLRQAGIGAVPPSTTYYSSGASSLSYPDIGAVQHQATGGGGTRVYIGN